MEIRARDLQHVAAMDLQMLDRLARAQHSRQSAVAASRRLDL